MNQDNLKGLKTSAKVLGREIESLGYPKISQTHLLEALSRTVGFESWGALRSAATTSSVPPTAGQGGVAEKASPYPKHWVAATYAAGEYIVDVIKWEDPILQLGYAFYAYDADTHRCLTPIKELLFEDLDEVPTHRQVGDLIDRLYHFAECEICRHIAELSEELNFGIRCEQAGCNGTLRPFIERLD